MKTFGLIGKSLFHSFSQQYFTEKFLQQKIQNAEYRLLPLASIEEVKQLLKHPTLLGFNVTIPYKSEIVPFLDELDAVAQEIGAVNCVVKRDNRWVGYNTDVIGFEQTLEQLLLYQRQNSTKVRKHEGTKEVRFAPSCLRAFALVLGSGGASKAVRYVLQQKEIPFQTVSLKKTEETITYNEVTDEFIRCTTLIINATPLGMFPNMDEMPQIPYTALHKEHILIDLIYNPEETLFLKEGKKHGALTINGLPMFRAQAEAGWRLFLNALP